jgi:hypothetical protein
MATKQKQKENANKENKKETFDEIKHLANTNPGQYFSSFQQFNVPNCK